MHIFFMRAASCILMFFLVQSGPLLGKACAKGPWQVLEAGLELTSAKSLLQAEKSKDQSLVILRADPEYFQLRLLTSSESGQTGRTIKDWAREYDLQAVINAGMFWEDLKTSAGYMKNFEHVNNQLIHPEFNAFLAFNPLSPELPMVQIVDRVNQPDWKQIIKQYQTVVQSYRMVSSQQTNAWEPSNKRYSVASVGLDQQGRILFIFSKYSKSIYELNNYLLSLPLDIQSCMFMEGGPTAGLHVNSGQLERSWRGVSEATLWSDKPGSFAQVPNALGLFRKKE